MAIVSKFSAAKLDFRADIVKKYENDPVDGIRSCRHLLNTSKFTVEDGVFVRLTLARCYMKIDANDFALRELKIILANRPNNPDAVLLIVSALHKLPGTSLSAPLEYFQNLYNELGSCEKVDDVFMIACEQMRESDLSFDNDEDLFVVPDDDIVERLKSKTFNLFSTNKYYEVISILDKADKKYTQGIDLRERLAFACQMIGDYKRAIDESEVNMKMFDNSFFSVMIILDTLKEKDIEYDKSKLLNYILNCKITNPIMLHEALVVLEKAEWIDSIATVLKNTVSLSDSMTWRTADAILDYHAGHIEDAIFKMKTVSALFGIHSCADEYIKIIESSMELPFDSIGELPQDYYLSKVQIFALAKEKFTVDDVNKVIDKEDFRTDLYFVARAGEVKIFEWVIDALHQATLCKHLDYFCKILLDEDVFDEEIRKIILKNILIKVTSISVPYSSNDVVRFTDFQVSEEDKRVRKKIFTAYATAYTQACFNARNFSDSLKESFDNIVDKIGLSKKYSNLTALSSLIALGGYIYFSENLIDEIIAMFGAHKATFNKYLKELNDDGSIFSDKVSEKKFMIQLNDIMKSFGKIEEMTNGNIDEDNFDWDSFDDDESENDDDDDNSDSNDDKD